MLEEYRKHVAERAAEGIVAKPLDATQMAALVELLKNPPAGEEVNTTERTEDATLIQTRHRIPETPLTEDQILIFQVPIPEPLRFIEPRETETRTGIRLAAVAATVL